MRENLNRNPQRSSNKVYERSRKELRQQIEARGVKDA